MVEGHPSVWATQALGRVYTVHLSNSECFYLRMILHVVREPTSFTDLKTVNEVMCETYREACDRLGLLESDAHLLKLWPHSYHTESDISSLFC